MKQINFFKKKIYLQIKSKESCSKIIKKFLTKEEVRILLNIEKNSKKYFVDRPDGKKRSLSSDGSSTDRDYKKWDQVIGKILRHGYESSHPDGGPSNRGLLEKEIGDVFAAFDLLEQEKDLDVEKIFTRRSYKRTKCNKFLHFNTFRA